MRRWISRWETSNAENPVSNAEFRKEIGIEDDAPNEEMTVAQFRKIALSFPDTVEAAHMGHPDFRVGGKIFATLGYPNEERGVLVLSPEEQQELISEHPEMFEPVPGGWGRRGSTQVLLTRITRLVLKAAMRKAWHSKAPKRLSKPRRVAR
jgi:hypothetical protein